MLLNLEKWVELHGDTLYRFALLRVGKPEAAEDLVQETLLAGLKNAKSFKGWSAERTWLIGILKYKIIDYYRHFGLEKSSSDLSTPLSYQDDTSFDDKDIHWINPPQAWQLQPAEALERK